MHVSQRARVSPPPPFPSLPHGDGDGDEDGGSGTGQEARTCAPQEEKCRHSAFQLGAFLNCCVSITMHLRETWVLESCFSNHPLSIPKQIFFEKKIKI